MPIAAAQLHTFARGRILINRLDPHVETELLRAMIEGCGSITRDVRVYLARVIGRPLPDGGDILLGAQVVLHHLVVYVGDLLIGLLHDLLYLT
jgi:hypothetical protein